MKKSIELSILCDQEVFLYIYDKDKRRVSCTKQQSIQKKFPTNTYYYLQKKVSYLQKKVSQNIEDHRRKNDIFLLKMTNKSDVIWYVRG